MFKWLKALPARRAVCMLAAVPAAFSCTYLLRVNLDYALINHSLVGVLLWWACWRLMERAAEEMNGRLLAVCMPLGILFSLMMVCGAQVYQHNSARLFQIKTWVGVVCAVPLFTAVSALFISAMPKAGVIRFAWGERLLGRLSDKRFYLLCWALIFLAWMPGLIATYPGIYGYDCIYQIDYYLEGAISTHHPLLHTWWLGFCVITLGGLLGSYEAGMCVYSIMQMVIFSAAFASILSFLRRRKAGAVMQIACLAVFMFMPTNAILSFSGTKDVVFAALLVWTVIWMLDHAEEPGRLYSWKPWVKLLLLGFGMMLFRQQGVYVFAFALLVGLVVMKGLRKRIIAALLAFVMLFGVYQGPLSALMKAKKVENVQEMLSVPIMQMAAAHMINGHPMPQEMEDDIARYVPDWGLYDFTCWAISDPIKNTFNTQLFREDPMAFFRLWAEVGRAYPETYINAFLRLTLGWWYPDAHFRDPASYHPYYEYNNTHRDGDEWVILKRSTPKGLEWLAAVYGHLSEFNTDQKIPVLSMLTSSGLAAWVMLLFIAWAIYVRRWRLLMPAALLFGLWGTLLLGPVVILRYSYGMLMAVPLMVGVLRTADSPCRKEACFRAAP